ncbi:hypothetical protein [Streptomyces sp. NPDC023838]|uniref:hypothetical protein n=1 Tax=Streptomyces sp. NPDC023838 TaxID=3154325 RepID=UPI0033E39F15
MLKTPARAVPSCGFDPVPVIAHAVRTGRIRRARGIAVLAVFGLLAAWMPAGAAVWVVAFGLAWVVGPSGAGWPVTVLLAPWGYALGWAEDAGVPSAWRTQVLVLPALLCAALAVVYAADHAVFALLASSLRRADDLRQRLPHTRRSVRRRIEEIDLREAEPEYPYDADGRFIGAGRDVRGAADIRLVLQPRTPGEAMKPLVEAELLGRISIALHALVHSAATGTDPLPGFSVDRVVALPAALWATGRRAGGTEAEASETSGPYRPQRSYLRAECLSWDGQLVVSLFVHTALQGGELRLTLRPQVTAPVHPLPVRTRWARLMMAVGIEGVLVLGQGVWRRVLKKRLPPDPYETARGGGPVSLRERFSLPHVSDLHQADDAERHIVLMQSCVLRIVEEVLEEHGVLTEVFRDEARAVINHIQVFGDNYAPIQNIGAHRVVHAAQTAHSQEGTTMNAVFPRRDPGPEPGRAPGSGVSIGGDNSGTVQNAVGRSLSHVSQHGTGQGAPPADTVADLLAAFRADIDRHAADLTDPQSLRDHAALVEASLADPAQHASALRIAARSLPALVADTAVRRTGEALASVIAQLLG